MTKTGIQHTNLIVEVVEQNFLRLTGNQKILPLDEFLIYLKDYGLTIVPSSFFEGVKLEDPTPTNYHKNPDLRDLSVVGEVLRSFIEVHSMYGSMFSTGAMETHNIMGDKLEGSYIVKQWLYFNHRDQWRLSLNCQAMPSALNFFVMCHAASLDFNKKINELLNLGDSIFINTAP